MNVSNNSNILYKKFIGIKLIEDDIIRRPHLNSDVECVYYSQLPENVRILDVNTPYEKNLDSSRLNLLVDGNNVVIDEFIGWNCIINQSKNLSVLSWNRFWN